MSFFFTVLFLLQYMATLLFINDLESQTFCPIHSYTDDTTQHQPCLLLDIWFFRNQATHTDKPHDAWLMIFEISNWNRAMSWKLNSYICQIEKKIFHITISSQVDYLTTSSHFLCWGHTSCLKWYCSVTRRLLALSIERSNERKINCFRTYAE